MKFAVIGSNSFSGSNFVAHLLSEGYDTLGISRSPEPTKPFLPRLWNDYLSHFKFVQIDLNGSAKEITEQCSSFGATHIVNFAAQSMVGQSWEAPADWYQTNVVSIANLANELKGMKSLEKFVQVTTPEVYGSTSEWISEGEPFNPSTPYAASRAAGDMHLRLMAKYKNFPVVFTRAANVFGPGQQLYRVVPKAAMLARNNQPFELHGGGTSMRSFIHIDDVSNATLLIARNGNIGEDYHISTDRLVSISELVDLIYTLSGKVNSGSNQEIEDRVGKDQGYFLSSSKVRKELGWSPEHELESGLAQSIKWVERYIDDLAGLPLEYFHKK